MKPGWWTNTQTRELELLVKVHLSLEWTGLKEKKKCVQMADDYEVMCPKSTRVGNTNPRVLTSISTEISLEQFSQQQVEGQHKCPKDQGLVYIKIIIIILTWAFSFSRWAFHSSFSRDDVRYFLAWRSRRPFLNNPPIWLFLLLISKMLVLGTLLTTPTDKSDRNDPSHQLMTMNCKTHFR